MKLYKYRPLSEFLFKELYYQELFFASYEELNDPFDLYARIEFTVKKEENIDYLIWFIFKTTLVLDEQLITPEIIVNNEKLIAFSKNKAQKKSFRKEIFDQLINLQSENEFIEIEDIIVVLLSSLKLMKLDFNINTNLFRSEIERITNKFLKNSYTTCFTETNSDFLMWSHYASKHTGICLEFEVGKLGLFPYKSQANRQQEQAEYLQRISEWQVTGHTYWDRIHSVNYQYDQPNINFFEFSPVFSNEYDCDLIGLSKSWTHQFVHKLEIVFSTKTKPWEYEKEWRAIEINFDKPKQPEDRIRHYPIEALTAIYFGLRTSEKTKERIFNIYDKKGIELEYYDCLLSNGRLLDFHYWESKTERNFISIPQVNIKRT